MLLRLVIVALLLGAQPIIPAQAFFFLLLASRDKPYHPPKEVEAPRTPAEREIRPGAMPAPLLLERNVKPMPNPMIAQSTQDDVLRRLDQLEQENRRLRRQLDQGSAPAPRGGLPSTPVPRQMAPGWWVHVYPHNTSGTINGEPLATYRYENMRFNAMIGFEHIPRRRYQTSSEMFLYRFEGWLQVREAGTYQIGAQVHTPFQHPINLDIRIDGVQVVGERHQMMENRMVFASRALTPGSYRIEMIWGLAEERYNRYRPGEVSFHPKMRGPGEMNFRDFQHDELVVEDRRDVQFGPPLQSPRSPRR